MPGVAVPGLRVEAEDPDSPSGSALIAAASGELSALYDGVDGSAWFDPARVAVGGVFLVARTDSDGPLGCAAVMRYDDRTGEVKRVYVVPGARGTEVAGVLMGRLEEHAVALGYDALRLETGDRQPRAIGLYRRLGYEVIDCWGRYAAAPHSICMEKRLT